MGLRDKLKDLTKRLEGWEAGRDIVEVSAAFRHPMFSHRKPKESTPCK